MKTNIRTIKTALFVTSLSVQLSYAAESTNYVACLSKMSRTYNPELAGMKDIKADTLSEKFLGYVLSKLPKKLESELNNWFGDGSNAGVRQLKAQVAEGRVYLDESDSKVVDSKIEIINKSFYDLHPQDENTFVLITPEGKVIQALLNEKAGANKIKQNFSLKDDLRTYYFTVNLDYTCKKNCDEYLWMVDVHANSDKSIIAKTQEFPLRKSFTLPNDAGTKLARSFFLNEVKYAVTKLVGVEKAMSLDGSVALLDPADDTKYNKAAVQETLLECEKELKASSQDKRILIQAAALLKPEL